MNSQSHSRRLLVLAALALAGVGISAWLTQHFYEVRSGSAGFQSVCNVNAAMNCDVIAASPHAELLPGIPLSAFATGWYLALFLVALTARNPFWKRESLRAAFGLTAIGLALSLGYLVVMATVIKTLCLFCLVLDGIALVSFLLVLSMKPEGFKEHPPELDKWKTLLAMTGVSLFLAVVLLKSQDTLNAPRASVEEYAASTLNSPVVAVGTGPEFPSIGPANAPITITEFSDFQCPYCRNGAYIINSVMSRYPGKVRVVFRNYPLDSACNRKFERSMHPYACEAARASVCANKQGKFAPVYESLFENQNTLKPGRVVELAKEAGADPKLLADCMNSSEAASAVARDIEEGIQLGVQSTPTFFVNGHKMEGAYPPPIWNRIIDELLAKGTK